MMFKTLALATLLISSGAVAQSYISAERNSTNRPLDQLYPGYQPTVFNNYRDVEALMNNEDKMPPYFRRKSQCYERAQIWSYNLARNYNVNTMKVFVYYTASYRSKCRQLQKKNPAWKDCEYIWAFHVSPYVLVRDPSTQALTEYVIDREFNYLLFDRDNMSSGRPVKMDDWTSIFVKGGRKCAEFVPYSQFEPEVRAKGWVPSREDCYIVRVPGTDYTVDNASNRSDGASAPLRFDMGQVKDAVENALSGDAEKEMKQKLGIYR